MISTTRQYPEIALRVPPLLHGSEPVQRRVGGAAWGRIPVLLAAQQSLVCPTSQKMPIFIEQTSLAKPLPAIPLANAWLRPEVFNFPRIQPDARRKATTRDAVARIERELKRSALWIR